MSGQAETAPDSQDVSLDSLAEFLSEDPEKESPEVQDAEESGEIEEVQLDEAEAIESDDESDEEVEAEPTPERKIAVPVKADDGTETTIEVSEQELVKSYERQADYTRKTQALATRENEAVQVFHAKHEELRDAYIQRAELATQAVVRLAGFLSDDEMLQLAANDPAACVQENQRQNKIRQILGTLEQQTKAERQQAINDSQNRQAQALQAVQQNTRAELEKVNIRLPEVIKIYQGISKNFGLAPKEFEGVNDHRVIKILQAAVAYCELKDKAPQVTQKAKDAPRMPSKQTTPASERSRIELNNKFKSGRAKLNDLAAYLS